jgi:hypothetical protein
MIVAIFNFTPSRILIIIDNYNIVLIIKVKLRMGTTQSYGNDPTKKARIVDSDQ